MGMSYKCPALLFLIFFSSVNKNFGQVNSKKLTPAIEVKEWILKEGEKTPALKNKIIIVEFWASWCVGCVQAFPHINELADKFSSDDVLFVSMNSYDKPQTIRKFLDKKELKTFVAADNEKATTNNFNVTLIPKTFILNKKGEIVWSGDPGQLTEKLLDTFINTGEVIEQKVEPLPFVYNISHCQDRSISRVSMFSGDEFGFKFENKDISTIIAQLLRFQDVKDNEYIFKGTIPIEPKLDMEFKADSSLSKGTVYQTVLKNLALTFNFKMDTVYQMQEVVNVTIADQVLFDLQLAHDSMQYSQERNDKIMDMNASNSYRFLGHLGYLSKLPVYFPSMPKSKFNYRMYSDDFEKTKKYLLEKNGLALEVIKKKIRVIHVSFKS